MRAMRYTGRAKLLLSALCLLTVALAGNWACQSSSGRSPSGKSDESGRPLADVVGVAHSNGAYHFTDGDFLNEGADQLLKLGTRVIKVWLEKGSTTKYSYNSVWPPMSSLVEMAQTKYYRALFAKPFTTFDLDTYRIGPFEHYYKQGMSPAQVKEESDAFYDLAKYLLTTYRGTGKSFILQNWEADNALVGTGHTGKDKPAPDPVAVRGMIDWLAARQDGVERARREVGTDRVMVYNGCEANYVVAAMDGQPCCVNDVWPHTHCDLYSWSCYDLKADKSAKHRAAFRDALDYLATKAPRSRLFKGHNIYISEFGAAENHLKGGAAQQLEVTRSTIETAVDWGVPYFIYWQIYDNDFAKKGAAKEEPGKRDGPVQNEDMVGDWLIRPDGSKSPVYDYLHEQFRQ